jgi:hypothetical protein
LKRCDGGLNKSEAELLRVHPELFTRCERCGTDVEIESTPKVNFSGKTLYFCDKCFKSVFKYDKRLKSVGKIWEEGGKKFPFVVRKGSWHGSTYVIVRSAKDLEGTKSGKPKTAFFGDLYLRGNLEKQDQPVGRPDAFIWLSWSEELARQHKDD